MSDTLRDCPAPAKLNLFLHITGRRADGYHELQTVFQLIDWADTLHFRRRADGRIVHETPLPGVPPESDLTVRAARLLQTHTRTGFGVDIAIEKRLPQGAGLGGGSSDAATTLLALNRLWQLDLPRAELARLGLQLGADVPFFVFGRNAFAEGLGERLQAVDLPQRYFLVVTPPVQVPTVEIFNDPRLTRNTKSITITDFLGHGNYDVFGRNAFRGILLFPYLVPSVARDFRARNLAVHRVAMLYPEIVRWFDEWTGGVHAELLSDHAEAFGAQYHRLRRFALEEVARGSPRGR